MKLGKCWLFAAAFAMVLVGCESMGDHKKAAAGTAIGAGSGAAIGAIASSKKDRGKGAAIGAAAGALVGGLIGNQMDKQEKELRQQMENTGIEVQRQGDTIRLQAPEAITFDTGKSNLKPQFQTVLANLAASVNQYPNTIVRIEGHTDSTGSAAFNQTLSEKRAASVANYLAQNGVAANRLETYGYGFSKPVADNATAAGRAANRRVEMLIVPVQQ